MRLAVLALSPLAFAGGCGDGTGPEEPGIDGTYALVSVDGAPLPFVLQDNVLHRVEVLNGAIILSADGTYTDKIDYRVTPTGGTAVPDADDLSGTFVRNLTKLRFTPLPDQGLPYDATYTAEGRIILQIGSFILSYER